MFQYFRVAHFCRQIRAYKVHTWFGAIEGLTAKGSRLLSNHPMVAKLRRFLDRGNVKANHAIVTPHERSGGVIGKGLLKSTQEYPEAYAQEMWKVFNSSSCQFLAHGRLGQWSAPIALVFADLWPESDLADVCSLVVKPCMCDVDLHD